MNKSATRKLELVEETQEIFAKYQKSDRWAVIVGISNYQHQPWNLNYAHRDAEKLAQLLRSESGGNFKEENIRLLTNENATKENIEDALYTFLQKPDKDDLVIIFFASHGAPDPKRPKNIYLLPYNTNPEKIASTGIRMTAIDVVLKETLLSRKVIILADTCHSGKIAGGIGLRSVDSVENELINQYLKDLTEAKEGVALLTSAEGREVAREHRKWGGGHGVFTHYLLEGMRGEADEDGNGIITVGELFEYVRSKVKEATNNAQHPSIGNNDFDRKLPLAIKLERVNDILEPEKSLSQNSFGHIRSTQLVDKNHHVENLGNDLTLEMVKIPSGKFLMGSPDNCCCSTEQPLHLVQLKSFWIGKYSITQAQWRIIALMDRVFHDLTPNPSHFKEGNNLPVEKVSWYDAMEFCARISKHTGRRYRLPSEAEWEYACRAKTKTTYYFSANLSRRYAKFGDPQGRTVPVGSYESNKFGIHDMHGQVWEWCADPWHDNYENAPDDGRVWDEKHKELNYYQNIEENLSELLNDDRWRIIRGGSWADNSTQCSSAFRYDQDPNAQGNTLGLRVVFSEV